MALKIRRHCSNSGGEVLKISLVDFLKDMKSDLVSAQEVRLEAAIKSAFKAAF